MRCTLMAVALSLGALGGCTCLEPVDVADPRDGAVSHPLDAGLPDGSAAPEDAGLPDGSTTSEDAGTARDASLDPPGDAGVAPDAGDDFCSGDEPRLQVGSQVHPVATTGALRFMNCCESAEITFHTGAQLGDLAELWLVSSGDVEFPTGDVSIGMDPTQPIGATMTIGASYYGSGMSAAGNRITGTLAVSRVGLPGPLNVKVCLTLDAPSDAHHGVRFWAPAALVMAYDWNARFAIHLLSDSSLDAAAAAKLDLDALALEAQPLLDLYSIRYYRRGDHFVAFDLDLTAERFKARLGTVPIGGKPFVVVADGERIYLGAFWTAISSLSPTMPFVMVETMENRGFAIEPQPTVSPDPRSDVRAMTALDESGKLAP